VKYMKHALLVSLLMLAGMAWSQPKVARTEAAVKGGKPAEGKEWTLYSTPYFAPDYVRRPVFVRGVTTEAGQGLAVTRVRVTSRAKAVRSVRLRWYLSDDRDRGVIILRGETPPIDTAGALPAGGTLEIKREVVAFAKIFEKVKDRVASGAKFHLDVSAGSVVYEDGGSWEEQAKYELDYMTLPNEPWSFDKVSVRRVGYRKAEPEPQPQSCYPNYSQCAYHYTGSTYVPCPPPPGQACGWIGGGYFDCNSPVSSPEYCTITNNGQTCNMEYCG